MSYKINKVSINLLRLYPNKNKDIPIPTYMTQNCSGMDIYAAIKKNITLLPNTANLIPTGFALKIPNGFEAQIRSRSGLSTNNQISILNSPGTIDADYRGEIKILLYNFSKHPFNLTRGDRIAQMIITKVYHAHLNIVSKLNKTKRNIGGFGHTGY